MIYLIDLEYVETRYTAQWKTEFPQQIADATAQNITVIEGPADVAGEPTPGAFLDFGGTNIYKSAQTAQISQHIQKGEIKMEIILYLQMLGIQVLLILNTC